MPVLWIGPALRETIGHVVHLASRRGVDAYQIVGSVAE